MPMTVLIVDADPMTLHLLEHHVTGAGFQVITATDADTARQHIDADRPAILVLDRTFLDADLGAGRGGHDDTAHSEHAANSCMPESSSETTSETSMIAERPYMIVLASETEAERMAEAFALGADDYLLKPFHKRELLARLRTGARIAALERELVRSRDQLRQIARLDDVTGLPNRRAAAMLVDEAWIGSTRTGEPLACAHVDIDHFERLRHAHGPEVADQILRRVATTLRDSTAATDRIFRMGEDEFLILLPNATAAMTAVAAERLRQAVASLAFTVHDEVVDTRISIGIAERCAGMTTVDHLLRAASDAGHDAKSAGRNCIRTAPTPPHHLPADGSARRASA